MPWLQVAATATALPAVWIAQAAGGAGRLPGEIVGPGAMVALAALSLAAPCLLVGAQFAALCQVVEGRGGRGGSATVYSLEAAEAVAAGVVFHFVLAEQVGSAQSALMVGAANVAAAGLWWAGWRARAATAGAAALVAVVVAAVNPGGRFGLDSPGLARRWRGMEVVAQANSRYGNVAVVRDGEQLTFYEAGLPAFTTEAVEADEVAVDTPLFLHPAPKRVLLISGGLGGALNEVLKHPVEWVDYVEMDRIVVDFARRFVPAEALSALRDPRVHLHSVDGRAYVKASRAKYDVIILLVPDPATTALSRFYTREFFGELQRLLNRTGIVCLGLSAPQAKLSGPRLFVHATVFRALGGVFPATLAIPGERTQYVAANAAGLLPNDARVFAVRMKARGIKPVFANETWYESALGPLPQEMLRRSLASAGDVPANTDARPVSCHHWLRLWLAELMPGGAALLDRVPELTRWVWLLVPLGLALGLAPWWRGGYAGKGAAVAMGATGFLQMGAQLTVVLAYQAVAGYLYHQIGLLRALFMLGLAVGSAAGRRIGSGRPDDTAWAGRWLTGTVALEAGSVLLLPLLLRLASGAGFGAAALWLGILGGLAFPFAVALASSGDGGTGRAAARLYAADLAGASLGAVLVGALMVPAVGMAQGCLAMAAVGLAAALAVGGGEVRRGGRRE